MRNYSEILFPQNNKTSLWYFAGKLNSKLHIDTTNISTASNICRFWFFLSENKKKHFALNCKACKFVTKFYLFSIQTNLKQIELNFQSILAPTIIKLFFTSPVTRIKGKMWFIDIFIRQYFCVSNDFWPLR